MIKIICILFIILFATQIKSQVFIDTVYSFTPGTGQNNGQSSEYYPNNIFGEPSRIASKQAAETSPYEILSLGLNGEIVVGLKNKLILNKEGVDFIIFENCIVNQFTKKVFAEPAVVSISQNGIDFIEFPYNIDSLTGLAGVTPTNGNKDPFDYPASGGDGFDLDLIKIDSVKYIKIKDVSEAILNNPKHNNYDATISGFDLDAVAIIHHSDNINSVEQEINNEKVKYYDIFGNEIADILNYNGFYFELKNNKVKKYVKIQ